ncbi:hypothetical protein [Glaciecola sp. SC05]|uniref:hypothetical protein n=1 Tax=Glaciecola sp. SC05 TaxID=1987355 RepID=UPI00352803E2
MSTKETLENMARNTWLAGLGSIDNSKEALAKSIDAAQEKSNSLYSELVSRGEEIQSKINETKDALQAKGKSLLGMGSDSSDEEKLALLTTKVDQLTTVVVALIEKRNADAAKPKAPAKRKAAAKPKAEVAPKSTAKLAPKAAAKPKTATKAAPKVATKPKASAATAPKAAAAPKTAGTKAPKAASTPAVEAKKDADTSKGE